MIFLFDSVAQFGLYKAYNHHLEFAHYLLEDKYSFFNLLAMFSILT
jgi:hypothetical protein